MFYIESFLFQKYTRNVAISNVRNIKLSWKRNASMVFCDFMFLVVLCFFFFYSVTIGLHFFFSFRFILQHAKIWNLVEIFVTIFERNDLHHETLNTQRIIHCHLYKFYRCYLQITTHYYNKKRYNFCIAILRVVEIKSLRSMFTTCKY